MQEQAFEILDELIVHSRDASIVQVVVEIAGNKETITGTSRRAPADKPDLDVATLLAYGRAYQQLGRKLLRRAEGMVDHADNIRAIRPVQIKRKQEWAARQGQTTTNRPIQISRSFQHHGPSRSAVAGD